MCPQVILVQITFQCSKRLLAQYSAHNFHLSPQKGVISPMCFACRTLASARVKRMSGKHQKAGRSAEKGATEGGGTARASRKGLTIKRTSKNKNKGATRTYKAQAKPSNKGSISGGARTSGPSQGSQPGSGQALARVMRSTPPQSTQLLTSY